MYVVTVVKKQSIMFGLLLLGGMTACMEQASATQDRVKAFKAMLNVYEPMGMVVRGHEPYHKERFLQQAKKLESIAAIPFQYFASNRVEEKSRAKPEIWSQPTRFSQEKKHYLTAVTDLKKAAQDGNLERIKYHYGQLAQTCKSCHDSFRRRSR